MTPFDFVKDVSYGKMGIFSEENESEYVPFLTNRAFSYYPDTVMFANEMNMNAHLDKAMQFDFYLHGLRKRKRYSPWNKREDNPELTAVVEYFQYSYPRAKEVMKILTQGQIDTIVKLMEHDGLES